MNNEFNNAPIVRLSRGHFDSSQFEQVKQLTLRSEASLTKAISALPGLMYYHAGIDPKTNTTVQVSVWKTLADAKQMDSLKEMLAQEPVMESAGVKFDVIANYEPTWKIEKIWKSNSAR